MKTILYQPLFINPQAYFVFPQLYHIEKGDSYIEPANITGQLIIEEIFNNKEETNIYNVSGAVKLDFLNMEEVANFAGTIKFTNVV